MLFQQQPQQWRPSYPNQTSRTQNSRTVKLYNVDNEAITIEARVRGGLFFFFFFFFYPPRSVPSPKRLNMFARVWRRGIGWPGAVCTQRTGPRNDYGKKPWRMIGDQSRRRMLLRDQRSLRPSGNEWAELRFLFCTRTLLLCVRCTYNTRFSVIFFFFPRVCVLYTVQPTKQKNLVRRHKDTTARRFRVDINIRYLVRFTFTRTDVVYRYTYVYVYKENMV